MENEFSLDMLVKEPTDVRLLKELNTLRPIDKPIILFGAGSWGIYYLNTIKKYFSKILFCDNNPEKWGTTLEGFPVISFDELKNIYSNSFITITSLDFYDQILEQLEENHLQERILISLEGFIDPDFNDYFNTVKNNEHQFKKAYDILSDDKSKQIFCDRINCCITADKKYLIPLRSTSPQYFESEIISLTDEEIFIDGGAYIGDTVEIFLKQTNEIFKKIYSFEPEKTKHEEFLRKFSGYHNIELYPHGLWSERGVLRFNAVDDGSSGVNKDGDTDITVVSIDDVLNGKPVTYIKMDIEGAELEALKGAQNTIKRHKPKLAICIYHKPLDLVEIPLFIKQLVPEYKIYIRHYNINIFETVCYAVVE
ncbi:FkbM family methyltransferase [Paenibacillus crassostreae]|uniref:Methyltransferase FkbM domain-containing protein n=1 Tax=Paenibacillus crassostreae TaxID=1763538 RepID=A0A162RQT6_9BACL|nr:FkbM family methyltransferase [Paenibacillus crassostreae]AOZ93254.1 hypothetical protein LPB68_14235 [Paenibacillus crassostreae]OAB74077.1 hypothetical protein PNBC_13075 [Paenibacillus crassostreae]